MPSRVLTLGVALLFAGLTLAADKPGPNDWPQWLGQNRDGKSPETGLVKSWPKDGPRVAWTSKDLGLGFGTPSVACGKIYGIGSRGGKDGVWALNEADGKELWFTEFADTAKVAKNTNGPSSTPTYADGKLFTVSLGGKVVCQDAATGKKIWSRSFTKKDDGEDEGFGAGVPTWGFNESVLVDGDKVICAPSSSKAAVAALNANTGATVWATPLKDIGGGYGYSSPIKMTVGGVPFYVVVLGQSAGMVGVHAETGKLLWQFTKSAFGGVAQIPVPIVAEDHIFASTAYGGGSALLQVVAESQDKVSVKEIKTYKGDPMNHHGGMILLDGYVYFGHGQNNGIPVCYDFKTGEKAWHADRTPPGAGGSAAYSYADGMLYVRYQNRLMTLVKPSPKEEDNKIVSSFMLPASNVPRGSGSESWPHPVIANGKMLIRDQNMLYCYDIKATTN